MGLFSGAGLFAVIWAVVFFGIFGLVFYIFFKGFQQWRYNNRQPQLTREATVVAKRTDVSGGGSNSNFSASTWYYVTFEVEDGERIEFSVMGSEYGLLAEGDRGTLTTQGTRYIEFERYI
ncbi:MAG: DUF2500 domain-containing protein [Erysipelotrichaceae bacterium]|nr:DUF2500 domain-containing protein [Erysipelotrichaceae bacterium]